MRPQAHPRPALLRSAFAIAAIACVVASSPADAWTVDEHRLLADSALGVATASLDPATRSRLRGALRAPWDGDRTGRDAPGFGSVCAASASDDHRAGRYHLDGRTVLEQLEGLDAARLDSLTHRARRGTADLLRGDPGRLRRRVRALDAGNVVANYLVHHVAALRCAAESGGDPASRLDRALVHEAIAQGFLADAFSAGHLMPPPGRRLRALHPVNRQRLHDHYGTQGVYVLDSRGETWHTLGDRLLLWYGPSFDRVFEACVASLSEVLAVTDGAPVASGVSGPDCLARLRLPGLLRIPTVAVATWSVRTDSLDPHGLRTRHHYPQLREVGGHDHTLEAEDVRDLPPTAAVPDWMVAPELFKTEPGALVRDHPDYASARFVQPRRPPPSYSGLIVGVGQAHFQHERGRAGDLRVALGFSPTGDGSLLLQRISVDALLLEPVAKDAPHPVGFAVGFGFKLPGLGVWREPWLRWIEYARLSAGHVWARVPTPLHDGARYTAGFETPVLPVRFTNAAVSVRVEAEWWRFKRPRRGVAVSVVMQ